MNNAFKDWERAQSSRDIRTIWMASGEVGSGKTRFGLSGPSPVVVQSLDKGLEGVVEPILNELPHKEIYFREYDWVPDEDDQNCQEQAKEIREKILEDFKYALKHARTILWDKETDVREVFQYAEWGSPTGAPVKDYAKLNQRYFNLINAVKNHKGVNVGFIQSMTDEWIVQDAGVNRDTGRAKKSFSKSGRRVRKGFDRLDELVMTEMHFRREQGQFFVDIGKCRQNASLQDKTFSSDDLGEINFANFGQLLLPGTTAGDWE